MYEFPGEALHPSPTSLLQMPEVWAHSSSLERETGVPSLERITELRTARIMCRINVVIVGENTG